MTFRMSFAVMLLALVGVQEHDRIVTLSDEPGTWKAGRFEITASPGELRSIGATAADAKAFESRMKQLADIFRASPAWTPPRGVNPLVSGQTSIPVVRKTTPPEYHPVSGYLLFGSFEHYEIIRENGTHEHYIGDETSLISVDVNRLPKGDGGISLGDDQGEFVKAPRQTGEMNGFPVYGDVLVVTTNGRPLYTPVSRERYLQAFLKKRRPDVATAEAYIADQQKKLEAFQAPDATAARQAKYKAAVDKAAQRGASAAEHERRYWERDEADELAALKRGTSRDPKVSPRAAAIAAVKTAEDELAGMSAADREAQACYIDPSTDLVKSGLVPMGTAGCTPIVMQNAAFFDPQLPRAAMQIITASRFADPEKVWKQGRPAHGSEGAGRIDLWTTYEVFRQADWRKIAGLLGK